MVLLCDDVMATGEDTFSNGATGDNQTVNLDLRSDGLTDGMGSMGSGGTGNEGDDEEEEDEDEGDREALGNRAY